MYGKIEEIEEGKKKLDKISPSFCMAKWMHVTIHLQTGRTHSCYLPPTHKVELEELKESPSALHNSKYKKKIRSEMKNGKRPDECSICWQIEDLGEDNYSDRHFRSVDDWTIPYFDKVAKMKDHENINPTYVEVSFSSACNFKCMYCSPVVSSEWMREIRKKGDYKLTQKGVRHQYLPWFEKNDLVPRDEEDNHYINAFWEWWPDLIKDLMYFRITGGEPLLSIQTFRILEEVNRNPLPKLELSINTNLGVPQKQFDKFLDLVEPIVRLRLAKNFVLHTSIDTYGKSAEYIRNGLNIALFSGYLKKYLETVPRGSVAIICTFNVLSIQDFRSFLEWVLELRKKYANEDRKIMLDIPHLQSPKMFSAQIITPEYHEKMVELIEYMNANIQYLKGFSKGEVYKMERILGWMKKGLPEAEAKVLRSDLFEFLKESDRRRGTSFKKDLSGMESFFDVCVANNNELYEKW